MAHVPFRGTGPALQAVISGHVQMGFAATSPLIPHVQSGALRPLAVTMLKRTASMPEVPTLAEQGYPGFEVPSWHGLVAPIGTPKEIIAKLNSALNATINHPEFKKQASELGVDLVGGTADEFRAFIKEQIPLMAEIVRVSGAKVE